MSRSRLFGRSGIRMSVRMRAVPLTLLALFLPVAALAQTAKPAPKPAVAAAAPAPKAIGAFGQWQAATFDEGGQKVCYAFTKAHTSTPAVPGRGEVVLTVTQRVSLRDAVALSAGFDFAANAAVEVLVDKAKFEFYTAKRSGFARDGHAVVAELQTAKLVTVHAPHPQKKMLTDTFGLKGFGQAYEAINKACPPK